jgi:hypothetical protein
MTVSKSIDALKNIFLVDLDGNKSKVIGVEGSECGHDCLVIKTQSRHEKELGIYTEHRVYTREV